jgi:hypothetical protein
MSKGIQKIPVEASKRIAIALGGTPCASFRWQARPTCTTRFTGSFESVHNLRKGRGCIMKIKKLMFILAMVTMAAAWSGSVLADCVQIGKVVHVRQDGGTGFYYISRDTPLPTYYYFFNTTDPEFTVTLMAAQAGNLTVKIVGDATSCPTSGTTRDGGKILKMETYTP